MALLRLRNIMLRNDQMDGKAGSRMRVWRQVFVLSFTSNPLKICSCAKVLASSERKGERSGASSAAIAATHGDHARRHGVVLLRCYCDSAIAAAAAYRPPLPRQAPRRLWVGAAGRGKICRCSPQVRPFSSQPYCPPRIAPMAASCPWRRWIAPSRRILDSTTFRSRGDGR